MPPRTTARGGRKAPVNAATSFEVPSVQEKPTRGLKASGVGTRSLRRLYSRSTSALNWGLCAYRVFSSRMPYWICTFGVRRHESPSATAPVYWLVLRSNAVSCRVNDAGRPASKSASELNANVPSKLFARFCCVAPYCNSVVSLTRCLLASSNQDRVFCAVPPTVRDSPNNP